MSDSPDPKSMRHPDDWDARYREGTARWDLGLAPPALRAVLDATPASLRILVPGCGTGHDAIAWAAAGHEVVGADFAPLALEAARAGGSAAGVDVDWQQVDVLDLPESFRQAFDLVWEQTCYCAIEPRQRDAYVRSLASALRPGGRFVGLFWHHGMAGGPPFDVTKTDVERRFAPEFTIDRVEDVAESVPTRQDEFLLFATSRSASTAT